ncbi:hypothetical protein [Nocardia jinanensis]|uniref:Uncharacterized protein n=1 Tax=Nocardia jinanensis TaxID=382504 RepID=A0A917RVW4_9NOCA|nr:hypothetical protein [Nocardia jinanensis]GGL40938.1 hypothetical protein GCM10011588_64670 [Nocardia jinanensis]
MSESGLPEPLDLEIDLLMGMRCDERLKAAKLKELGVSQEEAKRIEKGVDKYIRFGRDQFENTRSILRVPATEEENPSLTYRLTLWPDFDFVVTSQAGRHWWMARFVRASNSSRPDMSSPATLDPWSVCIQDFENESGTLRSTDAFPPWEEFVFEAADGVSYGADFSYGLLQEIDYFPERASQ